LRGGESEYRLALTLGGGLSADMRILRAGVSFPLGAAPSALLMCPLDTAG